jgi:hypothetical protein
MHCKLVTSDSIVPSSQAGSIFDDSIGRVAVGDTVKLQSVALFFYTSPCRVVNQRSTLFARKSAERLDDA